MAKTLGEMVTEVMKLANRTDSEKEVVVKQSINRRYRQILRHYSWPELVNETSVSVTGETPGLPANVDKVLKIYDRENDKVLVPLADPDMVERYVTRIGSGNAVPHSYSRLGTRGVHTQPSAATTVKAVSTNSGDDGTVTFRVKGYKDGLLFEEQLTVGNSTVNTYDTITSFTKAASAGTVTLQTTASTPVNLGSIGPKETVSRYPIIRLHPAPSSATTLHIVYQIKVDDLEDDQDSVVFPCEDILVIGAFSDLLRNLRQFAQAGAEEARFEMLLEDFTKDRLNEESGYMFMPDMNKLTGRR